MGLLYVRRHRHVVKAASLSSYGQRGRGTRCFPRKIGFGDASFGLGGGASEVILLRSFGQQLCQLEVLPIELLQARD